jgi:hypothetical protein
MSLYRTSFSSVPPEPVRDGDRFVGDRWPQLLTRYRVTTGYQGIDVMEKELALKTGKEISAAFFEPGRIPVPVEPRRASGPSHTASLPFLLAQRPGLVWPHDFRLLVWGDRGYGFDVWPDNYNRDHLHLEVRCDIGLGGCGV